MPIKPSKQTEPISYDKFHAVDYDVIGIVFSVHWINLNHDQVVFSV